MAFIKKCVGIVLAGGKSRRFGSPKALAEWKGRTFVEWAIQSISPLSESVVVITRGDLIEELSKTASAGIEVMTDIDTVEGRGPLAGIYSAMMRVEADYYLVSPCDMPMMESKMYQKWLKEIQINGYDCVVPILDGKIYPLNGVYHYSCKPEIEKCLTGSTFRVVELLSRINTYYMEIADNEKAYFINVNSKKDICLLKDNQQNDGS
jgi:molybdenum cofactor guanylyltransferase